MIQSEVIEEKKGYSILGIILSVAGWWLLASVYSNFSFVLPVAAISIVVALLRMNKTTLGLSLIFFLPHPLGTVFSILGVSIPATYVCVALASLLLGIPLFTQKGLSDSLSKFAILSLFFFIWFLFGPRHEYSVDKITFILFFGFFTILSMKFFFTHDEIQYSKIATFLALISVTYICVGVEVFYITRPQNLLDVSFFRDSFYFLLRNNDNPPFDYHSIGNSAFIGIAFLLCKQHSEINAFEKYQMLLLLLLIIVVSQARQALLGAIVLLYIKIYLGNNSKTSRLLYFGVITFLVLFGFFYIVSFSDVYSSSLQASSSEELVNREYDVAINMIKSNVVFGTGLGGYSSTGEREYPHNLILELLCEMGVVGTFLVAAVAFFPFIKKRNIWFVPTITGIFPIILIFPFFMRSMSSSDLTESILFLSMLIVFSQEPKSSFRFSK